jgi:ketosteroid isomerase-like protein
MADFDEVIEETHAAVDAFVRGDNKPLEQLYSRRDDVTLGNPFGPFVRGFGEVSKTMERAASYYRDGKAIGFELVAKQVTPALAFTVEEERFSSKIGGSEEEMSFALRVTSIFRMEEDGWRLLHRHADPITEPRAPDSVIQT